ncbi:response regulator [Arachnia rubra]|jgi:putative two-component system response regulator|uniref:Response regulator transcription factor n=1 Tax=Arachnia rubra TaxID=1547448 RepID=A0ABX7Y6A5_9ACTN|nr:response regulator transcription factor [Arachnia rubra]MBB1570250.1 response regulator transcription factor [Propionibacterium sp.]MBB1576549.1 response regulator transcription factor [Propionibacterium sp.]QUC08722.1 response regulator transcription factor [Arachnia rubra]BCR80139.1 DNA-binding response regulator [Arachnia rubra]
MIRVLLVDDQALIRTGFKTILETEPGIEVVGEAADGTEGIALALDLQPDVICMDVQMPQLDGIEATRQLTAKGCRSAILILTTFDRDDFLFETLQAGAAGFVLKTAEAEELIEAVQILGRGDGLLAPQVTRRVIARFTATQPQHAAQVSVDVLTEREQTTLLCLARGLTNAEIAAELFVSPETVKTHVSNILSKLGLRDRISAVIWAYEHGLVSPSSA